MKTKEKQEGQDPSKKITTPEPPQTKLPLEKPEKKEAEKKKK